MRLSAMALKDGLRVLAPPVPGIAFTTRQAGDLRSGLHSGLRSGGDDAAQVAANRRVVSEALGIPAGWTTARQVHGAEVLIAGERPPKGAVADAVVVRGANRPVAVLVADCVPIALAGAGVAAAVHAGWRGLCAGVIEASVARAQPDAGDPGGLTAWIGPCIGPCCFEVGPEVAERFAAGHAGAPDCSVPVGGSLHFDLRRASAAILEACGVTVMGGLDVPCTRCDPEFFSHRRDGTPHRQALVTWVGGAP